MSVRNWKHSTACSPYRRPGAVRLSVVRKQCFASINQHGGGFLKCCKVILLLRIKTFQPFNQMGISAKRLLHTKIPHGVRDLSATFFPPSFKEKGEADVSVQLLHAGMYQVNSRALMDGRPAGRPVRQREPKIP